METDRYDWVWLKALIIALPSVISVLADLPIWLRIPLYILSIIFIFDAVSGKLKILHKIITNILFLLKEERRLEFEINENLSKDLKKDDFPFNVKIKNLSLENEEDINEFIETVKKELVLHIKIEKNRSSNLFRCVQKSICEGYMTDIKPYISPSLADALDHRQIYRILSAIGDTIALRMFIKASASKLSQLEKEIIILDRLNQQGVLYDFFIPTIREFKIKGITTSPSIVKSIDNFFSWISEKKQLNSLIDKNIPKMEFVYVRQPGKDTISHSFAIEVALKKKSCKICILTGMGKNTKLLNKVISDARKIFNLKFEIIKDIHGKTFFDDHEIPVRYVILSQ
jgi:hypothetical protein